MYAQEPRSRAYGYVDARIGDVVLRATWVAGKWPPTYSVTICRLRDYTRAAGIETYNLRTSISLVRAIDFTDADNNWTAAEFNNTAKDNAALDAHFGSTQVYDYWQTVHGRNSWDDLSGKLVSYVH